MGKVPLQVSPMPPNPSIERDRLSAAPHVKRYAFKKTRIHS